MADFATAFQWMMQFEDPKGDYAQTSDACPGGVAPPCYAISGINSGAFPADFANIAAIPQADRGPAVEAFYQANFWNNWLAKVNSDDVAKRVFDFGVNAGFRTAVKTLQNAVNSLGGTLVVDGGWGPNTLTATNAADPDALTQAFIAARVAFYNAIVARDPGKSIYLAGWLRRAQS